MSYIDPRRNAPRGYDVAQVCLNGHDITPAAGRFPEHREKHCSDCGAETITECPSCKTAIRGHLFDSLALQYAAPAFCHECGEAYPWTRARLEAGRELADEFDELSAEQREEFKGSLVDLCRDTPKTELAVIRVKKIVRKLGPSAGAAARKVLSDLATESAKKFLGLP